MPVKKAYLTSPKCLEPFMLICMPWLFNANQVNTIIFQSPLCKPLLVIKYSICLT